jgi:hypothetical protein
MKNFSQHLDEATKTVVDFNHDQIENIPGKDEIGAPLLAKAGFRKADKQMIMRDSKGVEDKLNAATEQYGINWLIGYLEPRPDITDFPNYDVQARVKMRKELDDWIADAKKSGTILPPPSPTNTIVYVKPTSRVHTLSPHQMLHNIGHSIWGNNPKHLNAFKGKIIRACQQLQQSKYLPAGTPPPTVEECAVMLGRLVNLLSQQRTLTVTAADLENYAKVVNTGFNAWDENINDLFPAFINAGGKLNLFPRPAGKIATFDRQADIPVNQAVVNKYGVREWVWKRIASDKSSWDSCSKILTDIIVSALKSSTWAAQNGPVYPYAKLNTLP